MYVGGVRVTDRTRREGIIDAACRTQRPQNGGQTHVYTFEQMRDMADEMRKRHAIQSAQSNEEFEKMVGQLVEILQDDC